MTKTFIYKSIADVKAANAAIGQLFFSDDTMKFFNSRIESTLIRHKYFVTSEKPPFGVRRYTIRIANPDGTIIDTIDEFLKYDTLQDALDAIRTLKD